MIRRDDPNYHGVVCTVCRRGEFDHRRDNGRCNALTPAEYERVAIMLAAGRAPAVGVGAR